MTRESFYASLSPKGRMIAQKYGIDSPEALAELTHLIVDVSRSLARAFMPVVEALNKFLKDLPDTVAEDMGLMDYKKLAEEKR